MPSDWERAGAVVSALWDRWPEAVMHVQKGSYTKQVMAFVYPKRGDGDCMYGEGPTYVAALIDLGRKLDAGTEAERQERDG